MSLHFEKYAAKGNEIVNKLAALLSVPEDKSARILRATLHALRNRISIEESFHLLAQLPVALKGVYVDGWKPLEYHERIRHLHDFLNEIRLQDSSLAAYDFGNDEKARMLVGRVFQILQQFVSEGEMADIIGNLPSELKAFILIEGTEQHIVM